MATVKIKTYQTRQYGGFSPFGNVTSLVFGMKTDDTGAAIESDSTEALADGDVVVLGTMPEGWRLEDASVFVTTGMTASVTGKLGFRYADGKDSDEVPQDDAYFTGSANLATAGRVRANGSKLVVLPKDAELILTIGGADNAQASEIKVLVTGELTGPR